MGAQMACCTEAQTPEYSKRAQLTANGEDAFIARKESKNASFLIQEQQNAYKDQEIKEEERQVMKQASATTVATETPSQALIDEKGLEYYQLNIEPDQEIEFLALRKLSHEKDIRFSKKGIIDFIEATFAEEIAEITDGDMWILKKQDKGCSVYLKKNGSKYDDEGSYVFSETVFNSAYPMKLVIDAMHQFEQRKKWDKGRLIAREVLESDIPRCQVNHLVIKMPAGLKNSDTIEKNIFFAEKNVFYSFYSSTSTEDFPIHEKAIRSACILGMQKYYRRPSDNKIVFQTLSQSKLAVKVPQQIIETFLPKGVVDWSDKYNKYLIKAAMAEMQENKAN